MCVQLMLRQDSTKLYYKYDIKSELLAYLVSQGEMIKWIYYKDQIRILISCSFENFKTRTLKYAAQLWNFSDFSIL